MTHKILFVDCDGTIREPRSGTAFINEANDQRIIEGANQALAYYQKKAYFIIGITNQGGVAAGHKTLEAAIQEQLFTLGLLPQIDCLYFCPDYEGELCYRVRRREPAKEFKRSKIPHPHLPGKLLYQSFRKPGSGMMMLAIDQGDFYPDEIWMIGDRAEDEQAAAAANVDFMWADVWRDRFKPGMGDPMNLRERIGREQLLKFLAT